MFILSYALRLYLFVVLSMVVFNLVFWGFYMLRYHPNRGKPIKWPTVVLVIPMYNEEVVITKCLESLHCAIKEYKGFVFGIHIVDDGSTDDSVSKVLEFNRKHQDLKVVLHSDPQNLGKTPRLEFLLREALSLDPEIIVTVDADCRMRPNALTELIRPLACDPSIAGSQPMFRSMGVGLTGTLERVFNSCGVLLRRGQGALESVTLLGNAMSAIRSTVLEAYMDEITKSTLWAAGRDDNAIALTMLVNGERIVFQSTAMADLDPAPSARVYAHQQARWQFRRSLKYHFYFRLLHKKAASAVGMIAIELLWMMTLCPLILVMRKLMRFSGWREKGVAYRS